MSTRGWRMLVLAALGLALPLALGGCFQTPTSPALFGDYQGGGDHGGAYATPTPTSGGVHPMPTPGGGGTGSISGTVSGFGGESVTIIAFTTGGDSGSTTRSGDGAYTIAGLADGSYYVEAESSSHAGLYGGTGPSTVTISGGNAASGINITALY